MKTYPVISSTLGLLWAAIFSTLSLDAQEPVPHAVVPPFSEGTEVGADQLEELVAPVALYPDALIALILPASTVSSDVVLAARFLKSGGTISQIDTQPWEDSVRGLAHYPDVIKWMDENLSWTQRLGEAYLSQPQAVMDAIQRARAIARANGVLVDTPQQRVVLEESHIRIIPAQPDVIYVPRYDPEVIYVQRPLYYHPDPWLTFGIGFGVGSWLSYDLDWRSRAIWVHPHHRRHDHWRHHRDWRYRPSPGRPGYVHRDSPWHQWRPTPNRPRPPHRDGHRWGSERVRPSPLPGAPRFDRERWRRRDDDRFTAGRRPGVVQPDHNRTQSSRTDGSRREQWQNRQRERDWQGRSDGSRSGGSRRPGSTSNVVNNAAVNPAQVNPSPASGPEMTQRSRPDPADRIRAGREGRFADRRLNNTISPPSERRSPPQVRTHAPANVGPGERRRERFERSQDRRFRQQAPAVEQPSSVAARQMPSVSAPVHVPRVQSAPAQHRQHREYRQPARGAQQVAPSVAAAAPAVSAPSPGPRSFQAGADHSSRGTASYGGRGRGGEGRGGRDRRSER